MNSYKYNELNTVYYKNQFMKLIKKIMAMKHSALTDRDVGVSIHLFTM